MERSDIPVFIGKANGAKATSRFFIGTGNDNHPVTTKITSINFARLLNFPAALGENTRHGSKIFAFHPLHVSK